MRLEDIVAAADDGPDPLNRADHHLAVIGSTSRLAAPVRNVIATAVGLAVLGRLLVGVGGPGVFGVVVIVLALLVQRASFSPDRAARCQHLLAPSLLGLFLIAAAGTFVDRTRRRQSFLQWAAGGWLFLWVPRRREVGLGCGWLQRLTFLGLGALSLAAAFLTSPTWEREIMTMAFMATGVVALVVSIARDRQGVAGQREVVERRSAQVAAAVSRP